MENAESFHGRRLRTPKLRVLDAAPGRIPPHSLEVEQLLLSCCLIDGSESITRCLRGRVTGPMFYSPSHRAVFETLVELYRLQPPVDLAMLVEALREKKQLESIGGISFLAQITSAVPTTAQLEYFIAKLRELSVQREAIIQLSDGVEKIYDLTGGADELTAMLEQKTAWCNRALEVLRTGEHSAEEREGHALNRTLDKMAGKKDRSRELHTGLKEFDSRFGVFDVLEEEWLIGIGASTSNGKSSLSRNFADAFLRSGKTGLIFLLETSMEKWLELASATAAGVNGRFLDQLPPDLAEKFKRERLLRQDWLRKRLWICDESLKAETLCARVEEHTRRVGRPDFVVVDHLHELTSTQTFRGMRMAELAHIVKLLKRTAFRLNVPFFVPMQLNRGVTKDGSTRRPLASDIRDCGEIENACDKLILIHTPARDMREIEQDDNQLRVMVELILAKSRNGRKGHREFWFDRDKTRFSDIGDHELNRAKPAGAAGGPKPKGGYNRPN